MAVPGATTTTTAASTIYDEWIEMTSRATLGRIPTVYQLGALRVPLLGTNSNTLTTNLRDQVAIAGPLAETDEVTSVEITRTPTQVSTSTYAIATLVSRQAVRRSAWGEMAGAAIELTRSLARRLDASFTALASSFTGPLGSDTTTHSVENLVDLITAWRTRVGSTSSRPLMIMHGDAMRDLHKDSVSNAAAWFGASMGVALHDAVNGLNQGVVTTFNNIDFVASDAMPSSGTGWANMMIARGSIEEAAIAMPFEQPIVLELWEEPKRLSTWMIGSVDFGMGKINDLAGQTFLTKT